MRSSLPLFFIVFATPVSVYGQDGPPADLGEGREYGPVVSGHVVVDQTGIPSCQKHPVSDTQLKVDFFRCEGTCAKFAGKRECTSSPRDKHGTPTGKAPYQHSHEVWAGDDYDKPPLKIDKSAKLKYVQWVSAYCIATRACRCAPTMYSTATSRCAKERKPTSPWAPSGWSADSIGHAIAYRFVDDPNDGGWWNYQQPDDGQPSGDDRGDGGEDSSQRRGQYESPPEETYYGPTPDYGERGQQSEYAVPSYEDEAMSQRSDQY